MGDLISLISVPSSNSSLEIFCLVIINLFMNDKKNEAIELVEKIDINNEDLMNDLGVKVCFAIREYYNNNIDKSKIELERLSVSKMKNKCHKYYNACIFYHLGLIAIQQKDFVKSEQYLSNVLLYPGKCVFVDKAQNLLDKKSKD